MESKAPRPRSRHARWPACSLRATFKGALGWQLDFISGSGQSSICLNIQITTQAANHARRVLQDRLIYRHCYKLFFPMRSSNGTQQPEDDAEFKAAASYPGLGNTSACFQETPSLGFLHVSALLLLLQRDLRGTISRYFIYNSSPCSSASGQARSLYP